MASLQYIARGGTYLKEKEGRMKRIRIESMWMWGGVVRWLKVSVSLNAHEWVNGDLSEWEEGWSEAHGMQGRRKKQSASLEWAHECMVKLSEWVEKQIEAHGMCYPLS
jgi:hypothetical protein